MANYITIKQCANCFTDNHKDKNTCRGCSELMVKEIDQNSTEYQTRYTHHVHEKFANARKIEEKTKPYDITDLEEI